MNASWPPITLHTRPLYGGVLLDTADKSMANLSPKLEKARLRSSFKERGCSRFDSSCATVYGQEQHTELFHSNLDCLTKHLLGTWKKGESLQYMHHCVRVGCCP
jgi:hypothetical protein